MTISIWGKLKGKKPEVIDRASSPRDAAYLVREYKMAFGRDWVIWAGRRDQMPGDDQCTVDARLSATN